MPKNNTKVVQFLTIQLQNEVKTVEITLNQEKEAKLKHNNDFILLKYYIQLFKDQNPN